ncbi:MAG: tRNA (adenosine(37)-N6)-threonylcarbamoyltransferase complex ATPase subunit type 1 TsaE [Planctomycetota bacterium]
MKQAAHILDSDSVEQTRQFGQRIGRLLHGGEVIALTGQLGAGKTQLVKGIATGNGHQDASQVTSPTFTLVHEYSGRLYLYHVDAYRLGDAAELAGLGLDEMIARRSAVVIEWADRIWQALPADRLDIQFETTGEALRRITLQPTGPSAGRLLKRILDERS